MRIPLLVGGVLALTVMVFHFGLNTVTAQLTPSCDAHTRLKPSANRTVSQVGVVFHARSERRVATHLRHTNSEWIFTLERKRVFGGAIGHAVPTVACVADEREKE